MKRFMGYLLVLFCMACQKNEFIPNVEGEAIPYQDSLSYSTLKNELEKPAFSIYKILWDKADFPGFAKQDSLSEYPVSRTITRTYFLVENSVLEKAGISTSVAKSMPVEQAKELVFNHIYQQAYDVDKGLDGNGNSLKSYLHYPVPEGVFPLSYYVYQIKLSFVNGKLLRDGQPFDIGKPLWTKEGSVIIPAKQLIVQQKDMLEIMENDPDLSIFTGWIKWRDTEYLRLHNYLADSFGPGYEFMKADDQYYQLYKFNFKLLSNPTPKYGDGFRFQRSTFLAPSNEAFRKLGFNSLTDLIAFQEAHYKPQPTDWSFFEESFAVDDLLEKHFWKEGVFMPGQQFEIYSYLINPTFFSRILVPPNSNSDIQAGGDAKNEITLAIKKSPYPAGKLIKKDIPTLQGPLHTIDAILVPTNFKLDFNKRKYEK